MADSLEAQLVRGGISPAAAKILANAIANKNSARTQAATQLVDSTQPQRMRMIGPEQRRSEFTNLDSVATKRFADRIEAGKVGFVDRSTKHPYENAEPRTTTPRINTPSIVGGDLLNVTTKVEQDVQQTEIGLDVVGSGRHFRLSGSRKEIEAVDFTAQNETEAKLTNEFIERSGETTLRSKINGLSSRDAVLADGSAMSVSSWFDPAVVLPRVFSAYAKQNVMNAGDADELVENISEIGTWYPYYYVDDGTTRYYLPDEAYEYYDSGNPYNGLQYRNGLYFKLGPLVVYWFRLGTMSANANGNITASAAFHTGVAGIRNGNELRIGGLPFVYGLPDPADPLFQFNFRAPILDSFNLAVYSSASEIDVPMAVSMVGSPAGSDQRFQIITRKMADINGYSNPLAGFGVANTGMIIGGPAYSAYQVRHTLIMAAGAYLDYDLSVFTT